MRANIKIKHAKGKSEVFLNGAPITDYCLSCDIRLNAGKASGIVTILTHDIEIEVDGRITEKERTGNLDYLKFCQD